jgi:putative tricarboxylic transport membrane protein
VLSDGSLEPIFTRPICIIFVIGIILMILAQFKFFDKLKNIIFRKNSLR